MQKWYLMDLGKIILFHLDSKEISFDVYQRASDKPVFRILKNLKPISFNEKFLIKDKNGQIIKKIRKS